MSIPINGVSARLVADAELRFTPNGRPVANFRVATDDGYYDKSSGSWVKKDSSFWTCTAWGDMGENIIEYLKQGQLVIISGKVYTRTYETKEGEKRTVTEVEISDIGASLKWKPKEDSEEKVPF
jgi:single-strand DNA-binding protein